MYTMYKSASGVTSIPLETRLLAERKVFLTGEITPETACEFLKQVMFLVSEDREKPIHIYINSPGGVVSSGLMIYDCLQSLPCEVNVCCMELAASMAAILLAGGQKGRRYILPHSKVMIHEPLIAGGLGGSATAIQKTAESIMETKRLTAQLLARDTGKPVKAVEQAISYDHYMNAEEAIAFGICDQILTSPF